MSMLILILGVLSIFRTPVDIFPVVNIPVIAIIWNFNGMEPKDMEAGLFQIANVRIPRLSATSSIWSRNRTTASP